MNSVSAAPDIDQREETDASRTARALRSIADMIDAHPDLVIGPAPEGEISPVLRYTFDKVNIPVDTREAVAAMARAGLAVGAKVVKHQGDLYAGVTLNFGDEVSLYVYADRAAICERIVLGTREVTKEVPDATALAAVPKVTVTETVEDVEWRCAPILGLDPLGGAE